MRHSSNNQEIKMRVLLVPMSAMAETGGPSGRCRLLAKGFKEAKLEVATCRAEDVNYSKIEDIPNYFLDIPMPLGLPKAIASRTFPVAQKLGITSKKTVRSFDEVLWLTGNLNYNYLKKSVESIRKAINDFRPDIVYSEFNISAMIASKKEDIPLFTTVSYPTQHEYAHKAELARGLNRLMAELGLTEVESALKLFDWADKSFCPSIKKLEPIEKANVYYCGSLKTVSANESSHTRNKILCYMGNGTVSPQKMLSVIKKAFLGSDYQVYIASASLNEFNEKNIHVAKRWDFNSLLDEAVLFINHGGQNSIADGLIHKVPQIMVPGKVFERKYNAGSVSNNKAGVVVLDGDFNSEHIRGIAEGIIKSKEMYDNAATLGLELIGAGGIDVIIREMHR